MGRAFKRAAPLSLTVSWPLILLGGCSALINPDTGDLGGADLGGGSNGGTSNGTADPDAGLSLCKAGCAANERCNPAQGCVPLLCRTDVDCNDGNPCNGSEVCTPGAEGADTQTGCVPGAAKNCDDGITCTLDSCNPSMDCVHKANDSFCDDGIACTKDVCRTNAMPGSDGCTRTPDNSRCDFCFADGVCSPSGGGCIGKVPTNCSDGDACTDDTCDDAKSMCINGPRDADGDGVAPVSCDGEDCNDNNASVHPGAPEICDGEDDNCNRVVDEGCFKLPDKCDSRQLVTLVSGHADVSGALSDFSSNYGTGCGQSGGLDAVYAIPVSGTSDIVIDSGTSDARVVLAVAENCVDNGFTLACAGSLSSNAKRSRLMLHRYAPSTANGVLFLLVDGASAGERGVFNISIDVKPAAADDCAGQVFDAGEGGTVVGFVSGLGGQQIGSCQNRLGFGQSESIIKVKSPADDGTLEVSVSSDNFAPTLYARDSCGSADRELGCAAPDNSGPGSGQNGRATLSLQADPASDVFLFVDGAGGLTNGRYLLKCVP